MAITRLLPILIPGKAVTIPNKTPVVDTGPIIRLTGYSVLINRELENTNVLINKEVTGD